MNIFQTIAMWFRGIAKTPPNPSNSINDIVHVPEPQKILQPLNLPSPTNVPTSAPTTNREKFYNFAVSKLGTDVSPQDAANDNYGCADTINQLFKSCFGHTIADPGLSTTQLYQEMLKQSTRFSRVYSPLPGDIIISPTGYGNGAKLPNGHIGIVSRFGIFSNNSDTGFFTQNYTMQGWINHYQKYGGYPIVFFRINT